MDGVSLTPGKERLSIFRQVLPKDFNVYQINYAKIELKII